MNLFIMACFATVAGDVNLTQILSRNDTFKALAPLNYVDTNSNKYILTWYSFQDNTPSCSTSTSSGRSLIPYVSIAPPFRMLRNWGGQLEYGDWVYADWLDGRSMPNGKKHTGMLRVDDICGDNDDDSYCFYKDSSKTKRPGIDIYIGDITKSGYRTDGDCSGPAGYGSTEMKLFTGSDHSKTKDYGGRAESSCKCGDWRTGQKEHGNCYFYKAPEWTSKWC